ncbi:MAG: hypothetical protein CMO55_06330 [Verrucomicrobiales bacterium]|nr:hypothetical protein [Verrucomicrobiales bacterium]
MNSKVWLTVYAIFALLLIGGAGFFAFTKYKEYSTALDTWDTNVGTIETLEKKVPYPNEENVEKLEKKVDEYETAVDGLRESLGTFQRPLDVGKANTVFQTDVKTRVGEFRQFASAEGMAIEIEEGLDFQLGFDIYSTQLPPPDLVGVLDYELEAIDYLLRALVTSGAERMTMFERDPIPGEAGVEREFESSAVQKYPVRLRFTSSYQSFQDFINQLANEKNFFYIVRVLKVQNQMVEGPLRLSGDGSSLPIFKNPLTGEVATREQVMEWGHGRASKDDVAENAKAAGFVSDTNDARVLMGQEKLNVFMVVDIVRFPNPEELNVEAETEEKGKTKN